jgi:hypothetical protein
MFLLPEAIKKMLPALHVTAAYIDGVRLMHRVQQAANG